LNENDDDEDGQTGSRQTRISGSISLDFGLAIESNISVLRRKASSGK